MAAVMKKPSANKARSFLPKRGLARLVARSRVKRPAAAGIPYTRSTSKAGKSRRDRIAPSRSMLSFSTPVPQTSAIVMLKKDGMIRVLGLWDTCKACGAPLSNETYYKDFRAWSKRCSSRSCRCRYDVMAGHPFFGTPSKGSLSLSLQAMMLCCFLSKLTISATHMMTGIPGITVQRFFDKVRTHLVSYVTRKQDEVLLSDEGFWTDVEVDEVTLSKMDDGSENKPISWVQYLGIIRRGHPATLILVPLPIRSTVRRAPGPGPILRSVWEEIAGKYVRDKGNIILHTDSARAYKKVISGTVHTAVIHQVKKVEGVWVQPSFVTTETLDLPDGGKIRVRAGTQFIDGIWRIIRKDIRDSLRHSRPELVDKLVRVSQWRYWNQDQDLYSAMARTMPWA